MRTLVVTQNITIDGVVDAAGGWFDPTADDFAEVQEVVQRQAAASDAFLVGRKTFEDMRLLADAGRRRHRRHRSPEPGGEVRGVAVDDRPRLGRHHRPAR